MWRFTVVVTVLSSCTPSPMKTQMKIQGAQKTEKYSHIAPHSTIQDLVWKTVTVKKANGEIVKYEDCVITPEDCVPWDYKTFGYKGGNEISYLYPGEPKARQGTGVLPYAIEALLREAPTENVIVIVSKGVHDALGVHTATETYLNELKAMGRIDDFHILNSKDVLYKHNRCVEEGKKVYTLLHTTC